MFITKKKHHKKSKLFRSHKPRSRRSSNLEVRLNVRKTRMRRSLNNNKMSVKPLRMARKNMKFFHHAPNTAGTKTMNNFFPVKVARQPGKQYHNENVQNYRYYKQEKRLNNRVPINMEQQHISPRTAFIDSQQDPEQPVKTITSIYPQKTDWADINTGTQSGFHQGTHSVLHQGTQTGIRRGTHSDVAQSGIQSGTQAAQQGLSNQVPEKVAVVSQQVPSMNSPDLQTSQIEYDPTTRQSTGESFLF